MYAYVNVEGTRDRLIIAKLVGDCSTYNIGCTDIYRETKEGAAALVSWLLSYHLSCNSRGAYKLVFTNYDNFFSRSKLYELLKAMSFAETVVDFSPDSKASLSIKEIYKNLKFVLWNNLQ